MSRQTFERLVGADSEPEYAARDRILPHPVCAQQHWVSIPNPSAETFEMTVKPLLQEAHGRLASAPAFHGRRPQVTPPES